MLTKPERGSDVFMKKRVFLFLLSLLVLIPAYISAAGMQDFLDFSENGEPVAFELNAEIIKTPQFDENRTEQLNRLLKHILFSGIAGEKESEVTVSSDNEELFSILSFEHSDKKQIVLAPDHEHYYYPDFLGNPEMDEILPGSTEEAERIERSHKMQQSLDDVSAFFGKLPEAFPEKVSRTKNTEKYRDYGTASYKIVLKLTDEEMNKYLQQFLSNGRSGCFDPHMEKLIFTGRQGFTLLYTEDNSLLKVSYSGKGYWEENDIRDIRLEWKTARRDGYAMDELQLRTPDEKRTARNNLVLGFMLKTEEDGSENLTWSEETDILENRSRKQGKFDAALTMKENRLTGSIKRTEKEGNITASETILIDLNTPHQNSWAGTLEIIGKKDKIEKVHIKAGLSVTAGISVPVSSGQPEIIQVSKAESGWLTEKLYSEILRKLMKLPAEDLTFIRDGIPDSIWNNIVSSH